MTTLLLLIGSFFIVGWIVAITFAIRADWREYRENKNPENRRHIPV